MAIVIEEGGCDGGKVSVMEEGGCDGGRRV